jgi:transcription elongation GreA/GreB family factor
VERPRYFAERVASAVPQPEPADTVVVVFGSSVTILRNDGRRQTFRIVGEDEEAGHEIEIVAIE